MKYDVNKINEWCEPYGYVAQDTGYVIAISKKHWNDEKSNKSNWYKPEIYCEVDDDKYKGKSDFYIKRFAISFAGFGVLETRELENEVYDNIIIAKELVTLLNRYIDNHNNTND